MRLYDYETDLIVAAGFGPDTSGTVNPSDWFVQWATGGVMNDSGVTINGETILTSGPVYQAVTVIAGDIGALPFQLYRRIDERNKERDRAHPAHRLMSKQTHELIPPSVFREVMQSYALLWGNGVALIERNGRGEPVAMIPMRPDAVSLYEDEKGDVWYVYQFDGLRLVFHPSEVFHIRNLGGPVWGRGVIDLGATNIGYNLGLQKFGAKYFANGAQPGGVLQLQHKMSREDRTELRREWEEFHKGQGNAHRVAILQQGQAFNPMTLTNESSEFLESRRFSREEVAAWFNLPPYKLGAMENSAVRANLEQQNKDYVDTTLARWFVRWEEEAAKKLLTTNQFMKDTHFWKFNADARLRGDITMRYNAFAVARQWGWVSVNDVRAMEDMNGIGEAGDIYLHPLNMVNSETGEPIGGPPEPAPTTEPPADPVEEPEDDDDDTPPTNDKAKAAVAIIVRESADRMCRVEADRLRRVARKHDSNFLDDVTAFYTEWEGTLCGAFRAAADMSVLLGTPIADMHGVVQGYCAECLSDVVDLAGTVTTTEDLQTAVGRYADGWTNKSHALVRAYMGESSDETISS